MTIFDRMWRGCRRVSGTLSLLAIIAPSLALADERPREPDEVWSYLASLPVDERQVVIEQEAQKEGALLLYGATGIDRANFWIGEFNKRYPDIEVEFVRLKATELVEKVSLEKQTGRSQADLVITTITYLDLLSETGALAPFKTRHWDDFNQKFRYGTPSEWTAVVYEIFPHAIAWRSDRVARDEAPKTLQELADPKWRGRVGTTTHLEDFLNAMVLTYGEVKGMALAQELADLDNRLYRSHSALADGLASGQIDIAWGLIAARPIDLKKKGAPVDWTMSEPLFAEGNTISVATDTDKPYAAALFVDVLLDATTLEASDEWQSGRIFGNQKGRYEFTLGDYPSLLIFPPLSPDRYSELNRAAETMFIRRQ